MKTCKVCDKESINKFTTCRYHNIHGYRMNLKVKCFDILGWKCECCGEDNFYNLEIDHITPCRGVRETTFIRVYTKIIENPNESLLKYQILCTVCNRSKNARKKCTVDHTLKNRGDFIKYLEYIGRPI